MAIGNWELMHECFLKHSRMGTARMIQDNETDEDGQKRGFEYGKKVQWARIKEVPTAYISLPNQNTISINIKWYYFKR